MKTLLTALILSTMTVPAFASTWVTVFEEYPHESSDNQHRVYKIDVQSIANHQGWVHANTRICLNYESDCRKVSTISAQCQQQKLDRYGMGVISTLRKGTEWWTDRSIKAGTRYEFASPETLDQLMEIQARLDSTQTKFFNFLCKGTKR